MASGAGVHTVARMPRLLSSTLATVAAAMPAVLLAVTPAMAAPPATMAQLSGASGCVRTTDPLAESWSTFAADTACADAPALIGAAGIAVLPGGSRVLVASRGRSEGAGWGGSGVSALARTPNGALTAGTCVTDNATDGRDGTDGACADGDAMAGASAVAADPEGRTLYVAAGSRGALAVLRRDATGTFGPAACFADDGLGGRCAVVRGLADAAGVVVSPDGAHVYVSARSRGGGVLTFSRVAGTGSLTPLGCVSDSGSDGACTDATALRGASGMALSADGRRLYVAAAASNAVDVFARDPATGALEQTACYVSEAPAGPCTSVPGLGGVSSLALSPDGTSLYAVGGTDNTLVAFAVAAGNALRPIGCLEDREASQFRDEEGPSPLDACAKAPALDTASGVAVSPDGRTIFVTAAGSNALTSYARDAATGALTPMGCIEERANPDEGLQLEGCTPGIGLGGAHDVAVAPDGMGVYVASEDSSAVATFLPSAAPATSTARRVRGSLAIRIACPAVRHSGCAGSITIRRSARTPSGRAGRAQAADLLAGGTRFHVRPGRVATVRVRLSAGGASVLGSRPVMAAVAVTRDLSAHTAPLTTPVVIRQSGRR
jgi:DNA-binding beta-propeller fold protein YncE